MTQSVPKDAIKVIVTLYIRESRLILDAFEGFPSKLIAYFV